jgi:hypothetical protein
MSKITINWVGYGIIRIMDIKQILSFIGPLIAAFGLYPYFKDSVSGKVKPRIASWTTWTLVTGVATVAAISQHAWASAFLTGVATIMEAMILVAALKKGERDYNRVDIISQVLSVGGVVAWLSTSNAIYAILFNMIADFCGVVPTMYHSWRQPHEESANPFLISAFGSIVSFFAVTKYDFVNISFPLYLAFAGTLIGLTIIYRQRQVPNPRVKNL